MSADSLTEIEEWRKVPGFEFMYSVSSLGRLRRDITVRRHPAGIQDCCINDKGYIKTTLTKDGKRYDVMVHRLVLESFLGLDPNRRDCNHKNGKPADNRLANLEWCNASENAIHRHRVLGVPGPRGEKCCWSKLTDSLVIEMRQLFDQGWNYNALAKKFGVTKATVCRVIRRKIWTHI